MTRGLQPRPLVGALEYLLWSEWKFRSNYLFVVHTASLVVQMWLVVVWWPWWWSKKWRWVREERWERFFNNNHGPREGVIKITKRGVLRAYCDIISHFPPSVGS